jgi:hypothetical protein
VIESSDESHVIALYSPVMIAVFTRPPSGSELDVIQRRATEAIEFGLRGGLLYVVARENLEGGIDPRVRAVFEGMVRQNQEGTGASAVVVLTRGFAAAMVRGALAGLLVLFERRGKLRVFDSVDVACRWLAEHHEIELEGLSLAYARATRSVTSLAQP